MFLYLVHLEVTFYNYIMPIMQFSWRERFSPFKKFLKILLKALIIEHFEGYLIRNLGAQHLSEQWHLVWHAKCMNE